MKRVLGLTLGVALAISALGAPVLGAPQPKVKICHFAGHHSDVFGEWVTSTSAIPLATTIPSSRRVATSIAMRSPRCASRCGGAVLSVSNNGAVNGHNAIDLLAGV